jgi:LacI family sucrose operon transcriptional repressor
MIARGRKKIAYIGVTERDLAAGLARRLGVQLALREAGMESESMPRRIGEFNAESGRKCMAELLEEAPDLDGVICATDAIALGAMRVLKEKGRKVPEDVSVAGFGNSWAGRVSNPALTTIRLDFRGCGEKAARLLLDLIGGQTAGRDSREMLPFELLERESV